ncbi:hypothetical protein [Cupriavidus sp. H39]|uniref:hypothetical protein n=1 Tax=Cupriavidus sp. H39 TaxID=3401635 RepID=UPI003CFEAB20
MLNVFARALVPPPADYFLGGLEYPERERKAALTQRRSKPETAYQKGKPNPLIPKIDDGTSTVPI